MRPPVTQLYAFAGSLRTNPNGSVHGAMMLTVSK
jgi:hypothetical protein